MDIKELNKKQLVLLTLLITFVVSIATGIVTVSLMNQMPKEVPQTINNVIQRTIEKVTTVQVPAPVISKNDSKKTEESKIPVSFLGDGDALVFIYSINQTKTDDFSFPNSDVANPIENTFSTESETKSNQLKALGQGIIISDIGLILVDSNILTDSNTYNIDLNKKMFEAIVLKKFNNGFTVLKISSIVDKVPEL